MLHTVAWRRLEGFFDEFRLSVPAVKKGNAITNQEFNQELEIRNQESLRIEVEPINFPLTSLDIGNEEHIRDLLHLPDDVMYLKHDAHLK